MKSKSKYPNIKALCEKFSNDSEKFQKQFVEMKKQFPLVAIAYGLQKAIIKDLSRFRMTEETELEIAYSALTLETPYINFALAQEQRIRAFEKCLGIAGTSDYVSLGDCFDSEG